MGAITDAISGSAKGVQQNIQNPGTNVGTAFKRASLAQNFINAGDKNTPSPQSDPKLGAIIDKQTQLAQDYRANLPTTKQQMGDVAESSINNDTASGLKGVNQQASARGLLYSGIPLGQKANIIGSAGSDIANARASANQAGENEANRLDANATGQAYTASGLDQGAQTQAFNTALARQQSNLQASGSLGDTTGRLLARYLQNNKTNNSVAPQAYGTTQYNDNGNVIA